MLVDFSAFRASGTIIDTFVVESSWIGSVSRGISHHVGFVVAHISGHGGFSGFFRFERFFLVVVVEGSGGGHFGHFFGVSSFCLLYTSPSPRDGLLSRMPSSA